MGAWARILLSTLLVSETASPINKNTPPPPPQKRLATSKMMISDRGISVNVLFHTTPPLSYRQLPFPCKTTEVQAAPQRPITWRYPGVTLPRDAYGRQQGRHGRGYHQHLLEAADEAKKTGWMCWCLCRGFIAHKPFRSSDVELPLTLMGQAPLHQEADQGGYIYIYTYIITPKV